MMKILITGGAGFIGATATRKLQAMGHSVVCLDNFYTGSRQNLTGVDQSRLEIVDHDVREPLPAVKCDGVLHLACPASPVHYQRDPIFTWETSVLGTRNVLELVRTLDIPMVFASTSEVYGDPDISPQNESYWGRVNPVGQRSCYDEGKRAAETLTNDMRRLHGVDARIIRIFNTYGPFMASDDGRVVSNFIIQALQGQPLTVFGDGTQTRSFCYVDDLVDGILKVLFHSQPIPVPVNLGNPDERTILDLATTIGRVLGQEVNHVLKPLPEDDPLQRRPDITRARTLLDWQPQMALDEGIRRTSEYFRTVLEERAG